MHTASELLFAYRLLLSLCSCGELGCMCGESFTHKKEKHSLLLSPLKGIPCSLGLLVCVTEGLLSKHSVIVEACPASGTALSLNYPPFLATVMADLNYAWTVITSDSQPVI